MPQLHRKPKEAAKPAPKNVDSNDSEKTGEPGLTENKKKQKSKTPRTGQRPCTECMQVAVRVCADCSVSTDPLQIRSAKRNGDGFQLTLVGRNSQDVLLCVKCVQKCARKFEELGKTEWERALGKAAHCAVCTPDRHPNPTTEDLADFRRAELAKLRTHHGSYSQTCRAGFDSQQKTLRRIRTETGKRKRTVEESFTEDANDLASRLRVLTGSDHSTAMT